jgi:hypothetical protein
VNVILEMLANVNLGADLKLLATNGRVIVVGSRADVTITPRDLMTRRASVRAFTLWASRKRRSARSTRPSSRGHRVAVRGFCRNDLQHVPVLDDLALVVEPEDVYPRPVRLPGPRLEAVEDHVRPLGDRSLHVDALVGELRRHALEERDERHLAVGENVGIARLYASLTRPRNENRLMTPCQP